MSASGGSGGRPRVALLSPYWSFFADAVEGLAADRERLLGELAESLASVVDVVVARTVEPESSPATVVAAVVAARVDAVVVACTMASPPSTVAEILEHLRPTPVVVWAARRHGRLSASYTHAEIARDGATVGTPQLTSLLVRTDRKFDLVDGALDDSAAMPRVRGAAGAATAAGRIRRARIGRVGRPLPGYACVDADENRLTEALGVEVVTLTAQDFLDRYESASDNVVTSTVDAMSANYAFPDDTDGVRRSVRAAIALQELVADHRLDAGAFNCHVPEIRLGTRIGFAPCLALGHCTSSGVPWTCTGDVLTSVAMLTAKALTGASLYHELETYDASSGEFVVANSGEHDLAVVDGPANVGPNPWWRGMCATTSPRAGPATLIGFAQLDDGHRFIAAPGELTGRRFDQTGTSNGAFRFASAPASEAWTAWCLAGANHHGALTPHLVANQVARVAAHLGQDAVVV